VNQIWRRIVSDYLHLTHSFEIRSGKREKESQCPYYRVTRKVNESLKNQLNVITLHIDVSGSLDEILREVKLRVNSWSGRGSSVYAWLILA
jgi:hypothetical protein